MLYRWLLFFIIGLPLQFVIYFVYPVLYLFYVLFFKKTYKIHQKKLGMHETSDNSSYELDYSRSVLINSDDHNMLSQYTVCQPVSFSYFTKQTKFGLSFTRTPTHINSPLELRDVSGDCVISWCFAAALRRMYQEGAVKSLILALAKSYLKNLGTVSKDPRAENKYYVSARCNNFGLNYCPDGALKLGLPAFYPQFLTNSCLFALASVHSKKWKIIFWLHWIIMGGWFWPIMPNIYPKNRWWYIRDMTMKALYVHKVIFGDRWWIRIPMRLTDESVPFRNVLFEAMRQVEAPKNIKSVDELIEDMPDLVTRFWSQHPEGTSRLSDGCFMPRIKQILKHIKSQK